MHNLDNITKNLQLLSSSRAIGLPPKDPPAKWMYERVAAQIIEFEKQLNDEEEIGGRLVAAPGEGVFHIDDIGYWGPDMLIFHGKNQHGRPVQLLQHYTQLSVLLTAVPKESDIPRRIGFDLARRLEADAAPEPE
jgi:hypothetical protein